MDRRFQAAMVANLMNCFGLKTPMTVERLLGLEPTRRQRSQQEIGDYLDRAFAAQREQRRGGRA